jgi:hypothetical protein
LKRYQQQLKALLSPGARRVFERLRTPQKIQDYLDHLPANVLGKGEHTMRSPVRIIEDRRAHCMEGAMLAAALLAYHGRLPLLMDLESVAGDYDHVIALFKEGGRWGAISKTNYPVLRWRDPVYTTPRELAMSYFHEYFMHSGRKTLRRYSAPFNLRRYNPQKWVTAAGDLDWLAEELSDARHFPIAPAAAIKKLRRASNIEIKSTAMREWRKDGTRNI